MKVFTCPCVKRSIQKQSESAQIHYLAELKPSLNHAHQPLSDSVSSDQVPVDHSHVSSMGLQSSPCHSR